MDYQTSAEHPRPHRRRRRRLTITLTSMMVLIIMLIVSTNTPTAPTLSSPANSPSAASSPTQPSANNSIGAAVASAEQAASNAAQTVLGDQPGLAHVTRDVDGDTIVVDLAGKSETIRFIGMDTPETHDPRKPVQCYGPEAAVHTKALLEGKDVRLAADPEDSDRDKYGRLLRYVYLPDGTLVNAELIQDGYAFAYVVFPFSKIDDFRTLESQAQAAGHGLWSACNVNSSSEIKQTAGPKT